MAWYEFCEPVFRIFTHTLRQYVNTSPPEAVVNEIGLEEAFPTNILKYAKIQACSNGQLLRIVQLIS